MRENEWIQLVVEKFYSIATQDVMIGYHFRNIHDFKSHIPRIVSFWEIQILGKSTYPIHPPFDLIKAHRSLGIKKGEIGRWLTLFKNVLEKCLEDHPIRLDTYKIIQEKLNFFENLFYKSYL
jgi:truncated hemoglobin YjbI